MRGGGSRCRLTNVVITRVEKNRHRHSKKPDRHHHDAERGRQRYRAVRYTNIRSVPEESVEEDHHHRRAKAHTSHHQSGDTWSKISQESCFHPLIYVTKEHHSRRPSTRRSEENLRRERSSGGSYPAPAPHARGCSSCAHGQRQRRSQRRNPSPEISELRLPKSAWNRKVSPVRYSYVPARFVATPSRPRNASIDRGDGRRPSPLSRRYPDGVRKGNSPDYRNLMGREQDKRREEIQDGNRVDTETPAYRSCSNVAYGRYYLPNQRQDDDRTRDIGEASPIPHETHTPNHRYLRPLRPALKKDDRRRPARDADYSNKAAWKAAVEANTTKNRGTYHAKNAQPRSKPSSEAHQPTRANHHSWAEPYHHYQYMPEWALRATADPSNSRHRESSEMRSSKKSESQRASEASRSRRGWR